MVLWNFLVAVYFVYADIVRDDKSLFFEGLFNVVHKGRMLRVLMSFNNVKLEMCAVHCAEHLRCKTFNYHHANKDCELTDENFNEMNIDTITSGWYNYGTPPKIDGGWSMWRNLTACTKRCGSGTLEQWRDCDSPKPEHGGAYCKGKMIRTVDCNTHECKVENVALGKTATQSSTYNPKYHGDTYAASKAIDGSQWTRAYTMDEIEPWWKVDLGEEREIKSLRLSVDVNKYSQNLGLLVKTRTSETDPWILCKNVGDMRFKYRMFTCDKQPTNARYLLIQSTKRCYLRIVEVEILGY